MASFWGAGSFVGKTSFQEKEKEGVRNYFKVKISFLLFFNNFQEKKKRRVSTIHLFHEFNFFFFFCDWAFIIIWSYSKRTSPEKKLSISSNSINWNSQITLYTFIIDSTIYLFAHKLIHLFTPLSCSLSLFHICSNFLELEDFI